MMSIEEEDQQLVKDSLLVRAVVSGKIHELNPLLDEGANPNAFIRGRSVLTHFIYTSSIIMDEVSWNLFELLIKRGANPHINGLTAEHRRNLIFMAAFKGNLEIAKRLVELGVSPLERAYDGSTPLHWLRGCLEEVSRPRIEAFMKWLLAEGVDPRLKDHKGTTLMDDLKEEKYISLYTCLTSWCEKLDLDELTGVAQKRAQKPRPFL